MGFDRRDFLRTFGYGIAAFGLDPEKLLWVPGAKKIFIPMQTGEVEVFTQAELDAIALANRIAFGLVSGRFPLSPVYKWERVYL